MLRSIHVAWRQVIEKLVGYGYRSEKAILLFIILIMIGTITFEIAHYLNVIFEAKIGYYIGGAPKPPLTVDEYPSFCPFFYSIEVATPILDFGQESHFDIKGEGIGIGFEVYKWIHTFFGWLLSILIVLSPTKLLRRE